MPRPDERYLAVIPFTSPCLWRKWARRTQRLRQFFGGRHRLGFVGVHFVLEAATASEARRRAELSARHPTWMNRHLRGAHKFDGHVPPPAVQLADAFCTSSLVHVYVVSVQRMVNMPPVPTIGDDEAGTGTV